MVMWMQTFRSQAQNAGPVASGPQPAAAIRPRVRARRGQATDPHSIAERVRHAPVCIYCQPSKF